MEMKRDHLITTGVADDHIIELALDPASDICYRGPLEPAQFAESKAEETLSMKGSPGNS